MADEAYLSYEQVLQELQINRSELNRLIRDGRLKDHVISGETKFRRVEVSDLKKSLQKRPTVMAEEGTGAEPTTDVLPAGAEKPEPETEVLEGKGTEVLEATPVGEATDVLEATPVGEGTDVLIERPSEAQERDTEVLEEEPELELELPGDQAMELEKPLAEATPLSESALETDLELQAVRGKQPQEEEEDFFDFTDALKEDDFELEGAQAGEAPSAAAPQAGEPAAPTGEMTDELVGDILGMEEEAAGSQVSEEELLSEIMEIEGAEDSDEDTADITADITTMEEPTYEATELEDVLAGGGEDEAAFGDEFAVPIPEHVGPEAQATGGMVAMLVITLVILIVAGLFVMDNSTAPGYTGGLTSWALKLTGA